MSIFLGMLFFLVSFVLICAVLMQEGKGGGLAGTSSATTDSVMGTRNPLRRITAYCFVFFLLVVVALNYTHNRQANLQISGGLIAPATPEISPELDDLLPAEPQLPAPTATPTENASGDDANTPNAVSPAADSSESAQ